MTRRYLPDLFSGVKYIIPLCNGCQHETNGDTEAEAIAAWNTRPPVQSPSGQVVGGEGLALGAIKHLMEIEPLRFTSGGRPFLAYTGQQVIDAFKAGAALRSQPAPDDRPLPDPPQPVEQGE